VKILRKDIKHKRVTVLPEFLDDFWVLYNVIQKGDKVYAKTKRTVKIGDRYARSERGEKKSVYLGLSVEKVFWDRYSKRLRVSGIIHDAPDDIGSRGSHHTLNVIIGKQLTIIKDKWMGYHLEHLRRYAERVSRSVFVISIDDEGYCLVVLRGFGLDVKAEERITLPGKNVREERGSSLKRMFRSALVTLEELWRVNQTQLVILGLGFIKNDFVKFLDEKAPHIHMKIFDVKSVNSTGKAGIYEALRSGILTKVLSKVRMIHESDLVEKVLERLGKGQRNVTYGILEVKRAGEVGAVDEVLLTDVKLRETSDQERIILDNIIREIEEKKGKVTIISSEHEAGMKLVSLGGIAALLRYPLN
jgi:protein pelota